MCKVVSIVCVLFLATSSFATLPLGYGYPGYPAYPGYPGLACKAPSLPCAPLGGYPYAFPAPGCNPLLSCLCKKLKPCLLKKACLAKIMYKKNLLANKLICGGCGCGCGYGL